MTVLSPRVTLEGYFAAQIGPFGRVMPDTSYPLSLFVPPAQLGALQYLADKLRTAWRCMVNAALSRERLPDSAVATDLLGALCRELVRDHTALGHVVRVTEPLRLEPIAPLQRATICYPLDRLAWFGDRDPAHLTAPPVRVTVRPDGPAVAEYGALIGRLAHGIDPAALTGLAPALANLVAMLRHAGMLGEKAPARSLATAPGSIVHLGHATLLANVGGEHVLIDPWFPPASVQDTSPPPAIRELPPIAGIFITHHHWDHVHLETLLRLDKAIPIYVPSQDRDRTLAPRTAELLTYLGFRVVTSLAHGASVPVGDGEVVAVPFFGEDPTRIDYRGNCYVLRHGDAAALVHVDSGTDGDGRSLVSSGVAAELLARFGALDPVFATRRQERGIMIEHTWEFLFQPAMRWARPTENCDNGAAFLAELARATRTRTLVLYSEGGADWYPEGTDFLRGASPSARMGPHEYLWDTLEAIAAAVPAQVQLSRPFDVFRIG